MCVGHVCVFGMREEEVSSRLWDDALKFFSSQDQHGEQGLVEWPTAVQW